MDQLGGHCLDDVIGADERLIAGRYETKRPLGIRPALLMIDCYAKVFGDRPQPLADAIDEWPATCGLNAWDALPSMEKLLAGARAAGIPVIHTTGEARPGLRLGPPPSAPACRARTTSWATSSCPPWPPSRAS